MNNINSAFLPTLISRSNTTVSVAPTFSQLVNRSANQMPRVEGEKLKQTIKLGDYDSALKLLATTAMKTPDIEELFGQIAEKIDAQLRLRSQAILKTYTQSANLKKVPQQLVDRLLPPNQQVVGSDVLKLCSTSTSPDSPLGLKT